MDTTSKEGLRRRFLQARDGLTASSCQRRSREIRDRLFVFFSWSLYRTVHIFLPIVERREVDTWPIVSLLWGKKIRTITSIPQKSSLQHVHFDEKTQFVTHTSWGIPLPTNGSPQDVGTIDMAIIPLLAFDKKGNRVGYGKGHYDRFLAVTKALKVGVSFFSPVEEIVTNTHDVPMDHVVTPTAVHTFSKENM